MLFAGLTIQSITRADAPTTRPAVAKKPATQPIPKDWVKIENSKFNYVMYVPPKWKKDAVNDGQVSYFLPVAKNKMPPLFELFTSDCHESTLDEEVKNNRAGLTGGELNFKITRDEATTLGGQPAWLFVAKGMETHTLPPTSPNQKPTQIKQAVTVYRMIYVRGKPIFNIEFRANGSAYSDNLTLVQRVIDSFTWVPVDAKQ